MWDPAQYLRFADERSRPFFDLLGRVGAEHPRLVADLGCGPGQLTLALASRWPDAQVLGIDSSAEMIERASALLRDSGKGRDDRDARTGRDWTDWPGPPAGSASRSATSSGGSRTRRRT